MSAGVDRLTRVNALLKREIADYLESGAALIPPGVLASVTEVKCSVDMRNANVFVSIFGGNDESVRDTFKALNRCRLDLQSQIARDLKFKHTPKLTFTLDDRMAEADRVWRLLEDSADNEQQ